MPRSKHSPTSSSTDQNAQRGGLDKQMAQQQSQGKPLPKGVQSEMEAVFGTDFSQVRLHTDDQAVQMSEQLNAKAFTHQSDIYFNQGELDLASSSGKQLIAHELAHVSQQVVHGPSIQRKEKEQTIDQEVLETKLEADFKAIVEMVDAVPPGKSTGTKAIKAKIKTFLEEFKIFKPDWSLQDVSSLPAGAGYDDWKKWQVLSEYAANELSAKLQLIGLEEEAMAFYEFGRHYTTVGVFPLAQKDTFYRAYSNAAVAKIDLSSASGRSDSLDFLLNAFKFIVKSISELNYDDIKKDEKLSAQFLGNNLEELGFFGDWSFFMSLLYRLGEIYGSMQQIIQAQMELVYADLAQQGFSDHIPKVFESLEKIEKNVKDGIPFESELKKVLKRGNKGKGGKVHKPEVFNPTASPVAATRSEFEEKGGKHLDSFSQGNTGPSLDIEYYDRDQDDGREKYISITNMHAVRYQQLEFIMAFYGLNKKGKQIKKAEHPQDLMASQAFDLRSMDDWRLFLEAKLQDLTQNKGKNKADAFLTLISLLQNYLNAFTIHTPYNISEYGDNYLTRDFPKALTGQLIHDCGVFALKTVYMLSLVGERLGLKIQYMLLPSHIGLIISGDQTPTVYVHNNNFTPVPLDEAQFDSLSTENQQMILNPKALTAYKKARADGNTDDFRFTEDKIRQSWLDQTANEGIKGPKSLDHFRAEQSANLFIGQVDMPYRLLDLNPANYADSLSTDRIKKNLWNHYHKTVEGPNLFKQKALRSSEQFDLKYIQLTDLEKNFHNNIVLPYWNSIAHVNWLKLVKTLQKHQKNNDKAAYLEALKAYKTGFEKGYAEVWQKYNPIRAQKAGIHESIEEDKPLNSRSGRTFGSRGNDPVWDIALNSHLQALMLRIQNLESDAETLASGTDITPPFATKSDLLKPRL